MPLVPARELIRDAERGRYALGYFESWDLPSLQGTIDAAEAACAPVILGFNGEFLSHPSRLAAERLELYARLGTAAAATARVPCGLIFNECPDDEWTIRALRQGFTIVMPVAGERTIEDYARATERIVALARDYEVAVEAELGTLPHGPAGTAGSTTDPESAARFVARTGVDLLAVSVGNIHIAASETNDLDLDLLRALRDATPAGLVLHGGTGLGETAIRSAVAAGVVKVNYGTYLKRAYLAALREHAPRGPIANPHMVLGMGGADDLLVRLRDAVRDAVLSRIDWLGCAGKAEAWTRH